MKNPLFTLVMIAACALPGFSQSLSPRVLPAAGGFAAGGGFTLSYTIGEAVHTTLSSPQVILSQGQQQPEIDIITSEISGSPFCAGSTLMLSFEAYGAYGEENVFTAQLSDSSGSFSSPTVIGSLESQAGGEITALIPENTPSGSAYRIRVVSSVPAFEGKDNCSNLEIKARRTWYLDADGDHYFTGTAQIACDSPGEGYVTAVEGGGDCNDNNPAIHPGATEICNGLDDDCDGLVDTADPGYSDTDAPEITQAAQDLTIYCNSSAAAAIDQFLRTNGNAVATDDCSGSLISWTHDYKGNMTDGCGYTGSAAVNFTATDRFGNQAHTTATFSILDIAVPVLSKPADITVACVNPVTPALSGMATATDLCASADPESKGIWINEFHYAMNGADNNEFIEIAGPAGTALTGSSIYLYRASDGKLYHSKALSGTIPNQSNGRGVLSFSYPANTILDSLGGICLVKSGVLQEFWSYGPIFMAGNGFAAGLTTVPIPVQESAGGPTTVSLQRSGSGRVANAFDWSGPATASPGILQPGQSISSPAPVPSAPAVSYTDTQSGPGSCGITITRKWIATDACNNVSPVGSQKIFVTPASLPQVIAEGDTLPSKNLPPDRAPAQYGLLGNVPNPWSENTLIRFFMPEDLPARLSIFSVSGLLLWQESGVFGEGFHEVQVDRSVIKDPGLYFYQLQTKGWTMTRKMILLD